MARRLTGRLPKAGRQQVIAGREMNQKITVIIFEKQI
jgi:hypothetical protein